MESAIRPSPAHSAHAGNIAVPLNELSTSASIARRFFVRRLCRFRRELPSGWTVWWIFAKYVAMTSRSVARSFSSVRAATAARKSRCSSVSVTSRRIVSAASRAACRPGSRRLVSRQTRAAAAPPPGRGRHEVAHRGEVPERAPSETCARLVIAAADARAYPTSTMVAMLASSSRATVSSRRCCWVLAISGPGGIRDGTAGLQEAAGLRYCRSRRGIRRCGTRPCRSRRRDDSRIVAVDHAARPP